MADKEAKYSLNLDSNAAAVSRESAAALEQYRAKIAASEASIKELGAAQRSLRGSSEEVKAAKEQIKAKVDAERGAISAANLELLKQGVTYDKLASSAKRFAAEDAKLAEQQKKVGEEAKKAGAEAKKAAEQQQAFDSAVSVARLALIAEGVKLVGGAFEEVVSKAAGAVYGLGKFVVVGNDMTRSMALQREAVNGGAENAAKWGEQIDALARKVPTSVEKLNELSVSISKALSGGRSRATGTTIIDTFNAVGEAAAAAGDDVGSALESIIADGKRWGRIGLDPSTLEGKWNTGWEDIAAAVAKNLNVSVKSAKVALMQHRVTLDEGAKAIRDAVEARFGEVNAKKLISLDAITTKLHDNWINLTKGFSLEPVLEGVKKVVDLFDVTHAEGYALKGLFTDLGKELGLNVDDGVSIAKVAIDEFILGLMDLEDEYDASKKGLKEAFDDLGGIEGLKQDFVDVKDAVVSLARALEWVFEAGAKAKSVLDIGTSSQKAGAAAGGVVDAAKAGDAGGAAVGALKLVGGGLARLAAGPIYEAYRVGKDLALGVEKGANDGAPEVNKAMAKVAADGVAAARGPQGADAHSPSRKTEKLGRDLADGVPVGIRGRQPAVDAAMADMASPGAGGAPSGGGGGAAGGPLIGQLVINAPHARDGKEVAAAVTAPGVLSQLVQAIRRVNISQGIPSQEPATP